MGYRNAIFPPVKSSCLVSAEDADYEIQKPIRRPTRYVCDACWFCYECCLRNMELATVRDEVQRYFDANIVTI